MKKGWFSEKLYPDVEIAYKIKKNLYKGSSSFQKIEAFENNSLGKILVLDGIIQTTQKDEFIYHEMLAHIPLFMHPQPKNVLIIGGGDGGILREALKHPVEKVTLVEIDKKVTDVSKKFLRSICKNSFQSKKLNLVIDDGAKFIKNTKQRFDVVIVDSSDPIGPAKILFQKNFYQCIKNILNKKGIMTRQTGSTFYQKDEVVENFKISKSIFKYTSLYLIALPSYIGGFFSLLYSSVSVNPNKIKKNLIEKKFKSLGLKTKYYNPDIHIASFKLPEYLKEALN